MNARRILLAASLALVSAACEPSPETFSLQPRSGQAIVGDAGAQRVSLVEGDVFVLDTTPLDGDFDPMELCVRATSTAPERVEVRGVRGSCRMFVVSAKEVGSTTVTFVARDGAARLQVDVTAAPER
ncbi:MAG: hypothetical protein KF764_05005 [Labilithrix sp.]|nr:hypothetical protein [Labilithrix sp.]MBX3220887.1 hypothetical protein [Labilithrix sp.]